MSRRLRVTDELLFRARMGDLPPTAPHPEFDTVSLRIMRPPAEPA